MSNRILELREGRKWSQQALADRVGTTRQQIMRLEKGKRRLTVEWMERISSALECDTADLLPKNDKMSDKHEAIASSVVEENLHFKPERVSLGQRDLPVRGVAAAGSDALFITNGEPHDWIHRPLELMGVTGAYAVAAAGDSMEPRYFDGDVVYVHPGRRVTRGPKTFVVVQFHPQEVGEAPMAILKKYERQTEKELILNQYNPPKELIYSIETVKTVHRVIGTAER